MAILYCDARRFRLIILAGAEWVIKHRDYLNTINVFPVPDGDTGSNMSMTLMAAVKEIESLRNASLETTAKAAAWGALMGARGNSGIIMAQILSGIAETIEGRERLSAKDIAASFLLTVKKAYKAMLHPAEGTILTVIRETADAAGRVVSSSADLSYLIEQMVIEAQASVERTPDLLPKLKEAGVVDAGGLGFLYFLEGMQRLVRGVTASDENGEDGMPATPDGEQYEQHWNYRFCTEFMLKGSQISQDTIRADLASMGDSIVVVGDSRLARIHIHTAKPDEVLRYASGFGQVSSIKVDDMLIQHTSRLIISQSGKSTSVIAVVLGDGLKEIFYNAGAEMIVDGGPTDNPSTSDIVSAIEKVESMNVVILPNHKNIYPVAVQAAQRTPKTVNVLRTSTVPEGLSALLAYMDDATAEENVSRMEDAAKAVKSGEVAIASRDATLFGVTVKRGDSIGVYGGKIRCANRIVHEAVRELVETMAEPSDEIITLFYGDTITKDEVEALQEALRSRFQEKTIEVFFGGQPYAQYIISIE